MKKLISGTILYFLLIQSSFASVTWYRILMAPAGGGQYYMVDACTVANHSPLYWIQQSGEISSYQVLKKSNRGKAEIVRIYFTGPMGNAEMFFRHKETCESFVKESESSAAKQQKHLNNEFN